MSQRAEGPFALRAHPGPSRLSLSHICRSRGLTLLRIYRSFLPHGTVGWRRGHLPRKASCWWSRGPRGEPAPFATGFSNQSCFCSHRAACTERKAWGWQRSAPSMGRCSCPPCFSRQFSLRSWAASGASSSPCAATWPSPWATSTPAGRPPVAHGPQLPRLGTTSWHTAGARPYCCPPLLL